MKSTLFALALCLFMSAGVGCTRASTVAKVKNGGDVALAFQRIGSASVEPIPARGGDVNLPLTAIDVEANGYLQREAGVLRITCASCEGKTFTVLNGEQLTAPTELSVEEIVADAHRRGRIELPLEYQVSANQDIYPSVRTRSANIEYFEQTDAPVSELGWLLLPGGVLTLVGAIVLPQDVVVGLSMLVPGVALDVVGGIHLVLPRDIQRFDAAGKPVVVRSRPAAPRRPTRPAEDAEAESQNDGEAADEDAESESAADSEGLDE